MDRRIRGRLWPSEAQPTVNPVDAVLSKLADLRDGPPAVQAMALHNGKLLAARAYKATSPVAVRVELLDAAAHLLLAAELIDADLAAAAVR